jgi:hypothetical protein
MKIPKPESPKSESNLNGEIRNPSKTVARVDGRYDLIERTARFGEAIIRYAKKIPITAVTQRLIPQPVDAGTSVGANIVMRTTPSQRKISGTRLVSAAKNRRKQNTGFGWLPLL